MTNPLTGNDLGSRGDAQRAVTALCEPVLARFVPGSGRARLGGAGAQYAPGVAELEGFARPLWGLAPLAAGGGNVDWQPYLHGLSSGTDPNHPEYWGPAGDNDQRLVEMAAIAVAIALVPDRVWEPLTTCDQQNLSRWLARINDVAVNDNNWLFFKVIVNEALRLVDTPGFDAEGQTQALNRLERFYLGDGWYADGPTARRDYYVPWAMHFYGLLYARLAADHDPRRCDRFRERAATFAGDFLRWFARDGSALPFGRSLTYRFAQGAFWGALAFAGVEALPWGQIKGLLLRQLRWWARQPMFDEAGLLSIGYAYPNLTIAEQYNAPGSPYWSLKAFLPLALTADHPFWLAAESDSPAVAGTSKQPHAGMLVSMDEPSGHVTALVSGQQHVAVRHGAAKYAKFAYSTAFGFSVPAGDRGLDQVAPDSMLALSEDETHWRVRAELEDARLDGDVLWSRWRPWHDVEIETWLWFHGLWHARVHRIASGRRIVSAEGGFAVDLQAAELSGAHARVERGQAFCAGSTMVSGLRDVRDVACGDLRAGEVLRVFPNTNVLRPRTSLPVLRGAHDVGEHWLCTAVFAGVGDDGWADAWNNAPSFEQMTEVLHADHLAR
ncbi:DUF2264 domain-containing protein [Jiangella asiatica]|uniref:DUF2264 domain-containing protein n=1 Tax=Jiangella asiatica TaxID=2530372 RepID=UPI0013A5D6A3|nr:DUF2264 domain-containing protein [Jiangella asiatica]